MGLGGNATSNKGSVDAGTTDVDFEWSYSDEPHATRRKEILKSHPEVKTLFKPDSSLAVRVLFVVSLQIFCAYIANSLTDWRFWVFTYCCGGTLNHMLTLGMHEISHNLAFKTLTYNRLLGLCANAPLGIPAFVSFKRYHMDHHKYQGEDIVDVDVPSLFELRYFGSMIGKIVWIFLNPIWYSLRPMVLFPKPPTVREAINWAFVLTFDYAIYRFIGLWGLLYLVLGTLLGMGLHPLAAHFIAEHVAFITGQETYSYYGPLNWLSFNVGYHNEHHDLAVVPANNLPKLREMAPEYYDTLPCHSSWTKVIWNYITNPNIGPHSRIKRRTLEEDTVKWLQQRD